MVFPVPLLLTFARLEVPGAGSSGRTAPGAAFGGRQELKARLERCFKALNNHTHTHTHVCFLMVGGSR